MYVEVFLAKRQNNHPIRQQNNRQTNIKKYRKPLNINIGMVIFAVIFFYVVYCVIMYFQSSHMVRYEVREGSIAVNNIYTAIAIRDELVVNADRAGYVNFYAYEGERVGAGGLVYTIDETGRLSSQIKELSLEKNTLTAKELKEFRAEIVNYMHGFNPEHYSTTYEFKRSLDNTIMRLANGNVLKTIQDMNAESGAGNAVSYNNAPQSGIVAFWTDGYENLTADQVTEEIFEKKDEYEKTAVLNSDLIAIGKPAYKLSTNERWSIVVPVEEARGRELEEEGYIKVRFLKNQYEAWGQATLLHNGDGKAYLKLDFSNSMINFVSDRFLEVELIAKEDVGLKIPNSAIVEKEFFLIDENFVFEGTKPGKYRILKRFYKEDGTPTTEELNIDVYSYDEKEGVYYLDSSVLNPGDVLYKLDGQDVFEVSKKATLIGVYNINKGYADFKEIKILYNNDEYSIVMPNTKYGLNVYDYIVLDAASVKEDQFINK